MAYLFTTKSPFVQNGVALWQLFWMYELFGIVLHDVVSMFREVHFAVATYNGTWNCLDAFGLVQPRDDAL